MIIAITADGGAIDSPVNGNFDKCLNFVFYDTELGDVSDAVDNPLLEMAEEGGMDAAQLIVGHDAEVLLTGEVNPEAGNVLGAGGVDVYICTDGSVRTAVERFQNGDLSPREAPITGLYAYPGSPETPHTDDVMFGPLSERAEEEEEVVGAEVECMCVVCGETIPHEPGTTSCEDTPCPRCGARMLSHLRTR